MANIELTTYMITNVGRTMLPIDFDKTEGGKKLTIKPEESVVLTKEEFDSQVIRKFVKMGKLREKIIRQKPQVK